MKSRLLFIFKLLLFFLLLFTVQKTFFMLLNAGHSEGAPFTECLRVLWYGLRLDVVTTSYLMIVPVLTVVVSCFFDLFALRRLLRPYYVVVAIVVTLIFVADAVLYYYWGAKMDANDLMYAANPKDMFASVRWWSVIVGGLVMVALVWLTVWLLCRVTPQVVEPVGKRWLALWFVPIAGLVFVGMRGGVSESTANPSYAYFSRYGFCNHAALNPSFNMIHSLFKSEDLVGVFDFMPEEEAERLIAPLFVKDGGIEDTLLRTSRPDIVMIVWEGGGWDMVMNDSVGPNLMALSDEGVLFSNCYANNFRTDRGLVSLLSGWMGMPTTSLMKMADKCRKLPSLASSLSDVGYVSSFVYGGDVDFTNMRGYLHETGFEDVSGSESFAESRRLSSWGAPDAYTLVPSSLWDGERRTESSRRFDVILTLSSHEPWVVPMRRLADDRKNSFAYTDSCIGVFVDSLRTSPRWDSMLVIIVPDHGVPLEGGQSTSDYRVSHIPMVWTGGAVKGGRVVEEVMMQSDLAATLLAQMGLGFDDFVFSRNVLAPGFGNGYGFAFHAFKNGGNLIDSSGVTRFECADGSARTVAGNPGSDHGVFIRALLQYVYRTTGRLE